MIQAIVLTVVLLLPHENYEDAIALQFPDQFDHAYKVVYCESRVKPELNTGNGYYGAWQFDLTTWRAMGGVGLPSDASFAEQTWRARKLYDYNGGWSAWPVCGR